MAHPSPDGLWLLDDKGTRLSALSQVTEEQHQAAVAEAKLRLLTEDQYLQFLLRDGLEEEAAVADCEDSLRAYAKNIWPVIEAGQPMMTGYATDAICDHLQAQTEGHIKKLAILVPPGMAKSHLTCVIWPTWEWGPRRLAHLRYITASYSEDLTLGTNQLSRALIDSDFYKKWWRKKRDGTDAWTINPKLDNKTQFENSMRGFRFATSTGGTITGKRGHRVIFDDLHSAEDAESDIIRASQVRWMRESASNRVVDQHTTFTLIMQRLHSLDAASVAEEMGWTVLCLPMRYERNHPHAWVGGPIYKETVKTKRRYLYQWGKGDWRNEEGELLFPERFPAEMVDEQEENMGEYATAGQNQQRPTPRGGGMAKIDRLHFCQDYEVPAHLGSSRGWDFAGTKEKRSPYTAWGRVSIDKQTGRVYIRHCGMDKFLPDELEENLLAIAKADGPTVRQSMPQDPAQAGKFQVYVFAKLLAQYTFDFSPETGSKVKRFGPLASQINAGRVYVVIGEWNEMLKEQLETFPNGKFRDLPDALSRAYMDALMAPEEEPLIPEPPQVFQHPEEVDQAYRMR